MAEKHTPGPWVLSDARVSGRYQIEHWTTNPTHCYFCPQTRGLRAEILGWLTFSIWMCRKCRAQIGRA